LITGVRARYGFGIAGSDARRQGYQVTVPSPHDLKEVEVAAVPRKAIIEGRPPGCDEKTPMLSRIAVWNR